MDPDVLIRSIDEGFVKYLEELNDDDDFHEYEVGVYYPHTVGYCPRRIYAYYTSSGKPSLSGRSLNYVTFGRLAHGLIQAYLSGRGYEIEKEFELRVDDFVIKGRADAVYMGLPRHVIEIKTTGIDYSKPIDIPVQYKYQAHLYMKAFDADYTLFIFVRRSDYSRNYRVLYFDEPIYETAIEWVRNLHGALVAGKPPDPRPLASYECNTCPLRDSCPLRKSILTWT